MGSSCSSSEPLEKAILVDGLNEQEAHVSRNFSRHILPIAKSSQFSKTQLEERIKENHRLEDLRLSYLEGFNFKDSEIQSYSGWFLPTNGKEYLDCGKNVFAVCNNVAHHPDRKRVVKIIKRSCDRFECPICGKNWILKTTRKIVDKLEWSSRNLSEIYYYRPIHVTVSLPEKDHSKWFDKSNFGKNRTKIYRMLKKIGFKGGALIPHAYREKCKKCHGEMIKRPLPSSKGFEKSCKNCGSTESCWIYSPHFHVIGYATKLGRVYGHKVKELYDKTGYIIRNHEQRKDLGATVFYQLSHCTKKDKIQVVTWFGVMTRLRSKGFETSPDREENHCPYCGLPMIRVRKLFLSSDVFQDSEFEGFYLLEGIT